MRKLAVFPLAVLLVLVLVSPPASAQQTGALEIGYDLGFKVIMWDETDFGDPDDWTVVGLPTTTGPLSLVDLFQNTVRLGFHVTPQSELEPSFGLTMLNVEDETATNFAMGLDYLHNFGTATTRPFLKFGGRVSVPDEADAQFGLGAGVGAKTFVADRVALRYGVEFVRFFENDDITGHSDLGIAFGLSMFSK